MRVSGFMIPAAKVATCEPDDTIKTAVDAMVEKNIGALVVLSKINKEIPKGIVTKSDLVKAYQQGITLDHLVSEIMSKDLFKVKDTDSRDNAAKALEHSKKHHALVYNSNDKYVGFLSAWDLTAECARDDRAWPWIRAEDGKFHKPSEHPEQLSSSPTSTADERRLSHTFLDYIDSVRDLHEVDM